MLTSDFKSAIRSILRNKFPSAISIFGLGIGLGCIIILLALIIHEKSFDRFIPDHRSLYRIVLGNSAQTPFPVAESMSKEFPEVRGFFRYFQASSIQIKTPDNQMLMVRGFGFSDSSLFPVMGMDFITGTFPVSPLEIAVSDEAAMKYFGNLSPLGEVLSVRFPDGFSQLTVSGVFKSFPANSTLNPSFIADIKLSAKTFMDFQKRLGDFGNAENQPPGWKNNEFSSYVRLDEKADPAALAGKIEKYKEFIQTGDKEEMHFRLQPVSEIYLGSGELNGVYFLRRGNPGELKYFEIISLIILLISIANYVLLARAGVSEKVHQMGTRKVFGASHAKIRRLIILESMIIVLLSLIPATFVIDFGIDFINSTLNKTLSGGIFASPFMWVLPALVVLVTGFLAGWLIGLSVSETPALKLISGKNLRSGRPARWNYSFLVLHFAIFMILVSGVIAVSKQIKYSMSGYRGIIPGNVLVAGLNSDELRNSFTTICNEMKSVPGVMNIAGGSFIPPFGNHLPINLAVAGGDKLRFDGLIMGEGMTELLGIEVIEGSSFGPYKPGPPEVLINESSAKKYNVRAGENLLAFKVRGIVRDFNAHSLHTLIEPLVILQQNPDRMGLLAIKTDDRNDEAIIKKLRELFIAISPEEIFETRYLEDDVESFYGAERNQFRIIGAFSILAMVLSVMGLFGISLITISGKKKEIGIRKVTGASISEVLFMLNSDFLKWVLAGIVISVPVSILLILKWMDRFAYKTSLSWWIFAVAGCSAVIIAIISVSWQSLRAATRNPVEALRYE